jgi:hypothetical protein
MEDAKNLSVILGILESHWGQLTSNLTEEQLSYLESELTELEDRINTTEDTVRVNTLAKNFFQVFSRLGPLESLSQVETGQQRSGNLTEPETEIKIKIINYCALLKERIDIKKIDE